MGTSGLAGWHYRLQGSHQGKTVESRAPYRPVKGGSSWSAPAHLQPTCVVSPAMGPYPPGSQEEWLYSVLFGRPGIFLTIKFEDLARAIQQEDKKIKWKRN